MAQNVVELLLDQHQEIRRLAKIVDENSGQVRRDAFDRLRQLLAVHETAEEMVVHPFARRTIGEGERVVDARLHEENEAKQVLKELEKIGPDAAEFREKFSAFHQDLEEHATHEEREEFPRLAKVASPEQLKGMAKAVKAAESVAPTHPHPGTESPTKNAVVGPMAAVADRARDAINKVLH